MIKEVNKKSWKSGRQMQMYKFVWEQNYVQKVESTEKL